MGSVYDANKRYRADVIILNAKRSETKQTNERKPVGSRSQPILHSPDSIEKSPI